MKIEEIQFENVDEFISKTLLTNGELFDKLNGFIFRGHSKSEYHLIPSALRPDAKEKLWSNITMPIANQSEWEHWQVYGEYMILRDFYIKANNNGLLVPKIDAILKNLTSMFADEMIFNNSNIAWLPYELTELAALAQHYGLPTRLLDWTFDINVALYFASSGAIKNSIIENDNMVIWALNAQHIQFLQPTVNKIPLKFVVPQYSNNPNLNAQKGILTYWKTIHKSGFNIAQDVFQNIQPTLVDRTPLNERLSGYCHDSTDNHITLLYKLTLPTSECINLYKYLQNIGYGAARLFPGYDGVVREIGEQKLIANYT